MERPPNLARDRRFVGGQLGLVGVLHISRTSPPGCGNRSGSCTASRPAMASTPKYLASNIFRVAISNRRILKVEGGRTVTPAGESPGLACDSPQGRSPRTGWRFTCEDGLPLAQSAARSPKRGFALIPKWEYNLVANQYDRLGSTRIMRRLRTA